MDVALGTQPQGDRLSRLSQASLRINESLDFDTALQGVLDSARSLTGAAVQTGRSSGFWSARDTIGSDVSSVSGGIMPSVGNRSTRSAMRGPR